MSAIRHAIANAVYRIARAIDAPVYRTLGGHLDWGDKDSGWGKDRRDTTGNVQLHLRDDTPVSSTFKPPDYGYVYAALQVGRGVQTTFFLTRLSTIRLIDALRHVERMFETYGEGKKLA